MMKHGFTLIEVLVVVGIMLLLVGGGVAGYNAMNDRMRAELAANTLMTEVESLQKQASAGVSGLSVGCDEFQGIVVNVTAGNQLSASRLCEGELKNSSVVPTMPLGSDLIMVGTGFPIILRTTANGVAQFTAPNTIGSPITGGSVFIQITKGTNIYQVRLNAAGGVNVVRMP